MVAINCHQVFCMCMNLDMLLPSSFVHLSISFPKSRKIDQPLWDYVSHRNPYDAKHGQKEQMIMNHSQQHLHIHQRLKASLPGETGSPLNAYEWNENTTELVPLHDYANELLDYHSIYLTHRPTRITGFEVGYDGFAEKLIRWLAPPDNVLTMPPITADGAGYYGEDISGTGFTASRFSECKRFYGCLYDVFDGVSDLENPTGSINDPSLRLHACISSAFNISLVCPISVTDVRFLPRTSCQSNIPADGGSPWNDERVETDYNLRAFAESGVDTNGLWWQGVPGVPGWRRSEEGEQVRSFSTELERQTIGDLSFQCSLASPCVPSLDCRTVGSQYARGLGRTPVPSTWTLYAMTALKHINRQLTNQYIALKGAAIGATLRTFGIHDFYPKSDKELPLLNLLQGLTSVFALVSGFVPGVGGVALATGSATVGAIGAYLGRYVGNSIGPTVAQERYADAVESIYTSLVSGLDDVAEALFNGSTVYGDFDILEMTRGGAWLDTSAL
ncbi:MAG: hypothetical protein Q9169_005430 [Polycauliona sp. 2 TL-2023]